MSATSIARVVVLGATSLVGLPLLESLVARGVEILAVSRHAPPPATRGVLWCRPEQLWGGAVLPELGPFISAPWVCFAPLWVVADCLGMPLVVKPSKIIALSSTSRFSKEASRDLAERQIAQRLADAEERIIAWADACTVPWLILRPTLIHGFGRDRNLADIARFITRFHFFPLLGQGSGRRRPIHATEVACACVAALNSEVCHQTLTLSGAETITYAIMVERVFQALGRKPRLIRIPRGLLHCVLGILHRFGLARGWSIGMADRMEQHLDYPSEDTCRLLNLQFQAFKPDVAQQVKT